MASPPTSPAHPPKSQAQDIANPRRLLILTPTSQSISIIPSFLHALTGVPVLDPPQQQTTPAPDVPATSTAAESPAPASRSTSASTDPIESATSITFAGYTTHSPLRLETKYYSAEVPVWVDEIPLTINAAAHKDESSADTEDTPTAEQWQTEFLSSEAEIVREAVGALVICALNPRDSDISPSSQQEAHSERGDVRALRDLVSCVGAVKERIDEERGGVGDVPGVFVLVGARRSGSNMRAEQAAVGDSDDTALDLGVEEEGLGGGIDDVPFSVPWWEDQLFDMGLLGWEVVEWDPREQTVEASRNQMGEYEGMRRIKEVLETHDWSASGGDSHNLDTDLDADLNFNTDDLNVGLLSSNTRGFGHEVHELEREMLGLHMAIERGGGDGGDDGHDSDGDGGDGEVKVESMEALMMRMKVIRDMSFELPENERKKFAAKAVQDLMREI